MKTFVTEEILLLMKSSVDKSAAIVQRLNNTINEALEELRYLFTSTGVESIDIASYEPDFKILTVDDYFDQFNLVPVSKVEIWNGELYIVDKEGYEVEERLWNFKAPELLTVATNCLLQKLTGIQKLKVGTRVRWINPGIEDYPEEEREEILQLLWVIDSCPEEIEEDSIIAISNEYGEAEVLPMELVYVCDGEE